MLIDDRVEVGGEGIALHHAMNHGCWVRVEGGCSLFHEMAPLQTDVAAGAADVIACLLHPCCIVVLVVWACCPVDGMVLDAVTVEVCPFGAADERASLQEEPR